MRGWIFGAIVVVFAGAVAFFLFRPQIYNWHYTRALANSATELSAYAEIVKERRSLSTVLPRDQNIIKAMQRIKQRGYSDEPLPPLDIVHLDTPERMDDTISSINYMIDQINENNKRIYDIRRQLYAWENQRKGN